MKRMMMVVLVGLMLAACKKALPPEVVNQYKSKTLYTCCNIHYEKEDINDANYYVGSLLPLGSQAQVVDSGRSSIVFMADGHKLNLVQAYGTEQESLQQYIDKVLVTVDPKLRLATFSADVQSAIRESRVEQGMTREEVIMSIGYPATHRTPSTSSNEWTYWYNRFVTYKVVFGADGRVTNIIGSPSPTKNQPVK